MERFPKPKSLWITKLMVFVDVFCPLLTKPSSTTFEMELLSRNNKTNILYPDCRKTSDFKMRFLRFRRRTHAYQ
jgi:hypothetical protein